MDSGKVLGYLPPMEVKMKVSVAIVKDGESAARPADCRSVLIGPGIDLLPAPDLKPWRTANREPDHHR